MISTLLALVGPWALARFGGGMIVKLLVAKGVPAIAAKPLAGVINNIAQKLLAGHPLSQEEQQQLDYHRAITKPATVGSSPGTPFQAV